MTALNAVMQSRGKLMALLLLFAPLVKADLLPTTVNMQLLSSPGEPSFYQFLVNGKSTILTLCDDPSHQISNTPFVATETTLSDLTGTLLERNGDPNALLDYERIAILDLQAFANPSIVGDVILAEWAITQGRPNRAGSPGAQDLVNWVWTQNPANYNLSGFVIFTTPLDQEQTSFVPEPESWLLLATVVGSIGVAFSRSHKTR